MDSKLANHKACFVFSVRHRSIWKKCAGGVGSSDRPGLMRRILRFEGRFDQAAASSLGIKHAAVDGRPLRASKKKQER
jgi:hypothetical protein